MADLRTYIKVEGEFFELLEGQPLVAGRSRECDLVLDDNLASREHCRFVLKDDVVRVVDLESYNGVLLNGLEIDDEARLHHGDVLTVGSTMITIARQQREVRTRIPAAPDRTADDSEEFTSTATLEEILLRGTQRSLENAQLQEADQTGRILFPELRARTRGESGLKDDILRQGVAIGIELAERLSDVNWLAQVLELLASAERPLSGDADRFRAAVESVGRPPRGLDEYLAMVEKKGFPTNGLDLL